MLYRILRLGLVVSRFFKAKLEKNNHMTARVCTRRAKTKRKQHMVMNEIESDRTSQERLMLWVTTRDVRDRDQIEIQNYMKSLILLFLVDI